MFRTAANIEVAARMQTDQAVIMAILLASLVLFIWGRWRHDMVAMAALLAAVLAGVVPAGEAFAGFGHPAVVTVACVLILSGALQSSGVVDALTRLALPRSGRPLVTLAALCGLCAVLSGFMNNTGALALLMPVAIQAASREGMPAGRVLMPLAFASVLGGLATLIGTPPNLIVAGFRAAESGAGFSMFDFAPVGLPVAAAGIAFVVLCAGLLVPARRGAGAEGFEIGAYLTELQVTDGSGAEGRTVGAIEQLLEEDDIQVIALLRADRKVPGPLAEQEVRAGDILVVEAGPEGLASGLAALGLKLEEDVPTDGASLPGAGHEGSGTEAEAAPADAADDPAVTEYVVLPGAAIAGRSATDIRLRDRYGVNLLAVSRQGQRSRSRLRTMSLRPGDVLLLQGRPAALADFAGQYGCVPLAERSLRIPGSRQAWIAGGIMAAAVAAATTGLASSAIAFSGAVLAAMATRVVQPRAVYGMVDWTVIVLLGALMPVADAMEATGAAAVIADLLLGYLAAGSVFWALAIILVATMLLSDAMNNAATAAVMCPIALAAASQLSASPDPFLMAVAIGASCAFLTPIGHQTSTLILGPGGFRFGDYWRLGLPLEILCAAIALPLLLLVWPP
jgi:di/tricarboxylate transporter